MQGGNVRRWCSVFQIFFRTRAFGLVTPAGWQPATQQAASLRYWMGRRRFANEKAPSPLRSAGALHMTAFPGLPNAGIMALWNEPIL